MNNDVFEMDKSKKYFFPNDIEPIFHAGYLILVSPQNANWIVLENQTQIHIVKSLMKGISVGDVYDKIKAPSDLVYVLNEIEGKHFCERMIINDEKEFTLRIYLTNRCNLRCNHCFMFADKQLPNELTFEEIIKLIDSSRKHGCSKVIFTGGEVCLKENFIEILKYSHDNGLYVQVLSNGTIWTAEKIKEAAKYIDEIQISIDGFDEESNSKVRGKGFFSKSLQCVEAFSKEDVFVSVIITPLYGMLDELRERYISFAKELISKYGTEKFLIIIAKELISGRLIKADKNRNKKMAQIVGEIYEEIYQNAELTTFVMNHKNNRIFKNCGYGGLTINSNGDVYFCGRIHELKSYGNIRDIAFDTILKKRILARRKSYVDNITPCNTCNIRYICGGGCRIDNVKEICNLDLNTQGLLHRNCSKEEKEKIYKLMIESNEFLYW